MDAAKPSYRWYVLIMLAVMYAFSIMDRQILSILLEDIRAEFVLTDLQLGLLSGVAFALFYATLGIPIARLADRYSRVNIISIAVALWSVMTALCGAASSFWYLFLARVGVGVGEAGGNPPAHSVISDYFNKDERSFALSVYTSGAALGLLLGLVTGGFIAEYYGWRWAFVCAGVPGLALALVLKLTVREPVRGGLEEGNSSSSRIDESFLATFRRLWANRPYRFVNLGYSISIFVGYAYTIWLPALYLRQFDLSQSQVGVVVGFTSAGLGTAGLLAGGYLADRLGKRDSRGPALMCMVALLMTLPVYLTALWSSDWIVTTVFFGAGLFLFSLSQAPGLAIIQTVVAPNQRAQAAAYVMFLANILGLGLGPVLLGALSDMFAPEYDYRSLNIALGIITLALVPAAIFYGLTGKVLREHRPSKRHVP